MQVGKMLGPAASLTMCFVMFLYPFGSCIAYLVIVGDSFQPLLLAAFGAAWWTRRAAVITGIGCTCILPLCFPTRLAALKGKSGTVSSLCVYGLMSVVGIIVFRSTQIVVSPDYSWAPVKAFNPSIQFLNALPLIVFAFHCHTNIVSIWDELEEHPSLFFRLTSTTPSSPTAAAGEDGKQQRQQKSEKLRGMIRVVMAGVSIVGVFYSCVALAGYLAFPDTARSNITLNFRQDDWLMQAARACIGLIQICAYPVNHHPARGAVRDLIFQTTDRTVGGRAFYALEPLAFFGTTLALALVCSDLGVILKLVGGTCGAMLIFLMPGALLVQYSLTKHRASRRQQPLREPLLPGGEAAAEAGDSGAHTPHGQQHVHATEAFSLWWSILFWTAIVLLLLGSFVALLAIITTIRPLS
ncbi:hypothetical protein CHLNCDRAFT_50436 [Chlorella variabilis]|uniref:Amino acid transporter transmembrane domain-containing protein n=1 Tax=Chlorella variabilis TaxID=554065 RepID=E1Z6A6_CHLVA|nr:hypothetical protein CHLNCDRAFT_50436 [Chlorella variabilis]EFN58616.1 hypothetical protein CHLNCDRAFT_50436 [Chlorella variabilis]|eukprot:XP_005850718.1 hypothetical protein CHLNCDRAFT_50436 [Chlorella variabilis]